ncbi:cytosol aminopeptidase [Drosophila grimshawi]|uniref:Cytosol aminopeptidase n=1 Tax=Drosophila grimshawi TaxID=7222 RepID=B4J1L0_DROGR|nr:cytosol aminopeptidase [Drosophila grimshawi]EDV96930.1 GH14947 [Drosophila grimshawi]
MQNLRRILLKGRTNRSLQVITKMCYSCGKEVQRGRGLVLGVYQREGNKELKLTTSAEKFNDRVGGKLMELICETKIDGRLGRGKVFNNIDIDYRSVAVVGVGLEGIGFNELEMLDEGMENVRIAAGIGAQALQTVNCSEISVDSMDYAEQAAEGAALAIWQYTEKLSVKYRPVMPKLDMYDSADMDGWMRGMCKAESQNLARRLSDAPANCMTPTLFAQATVDALCPCGITVEIRTMDWIEQQRMNSFLMIAKGSCEPPVLMEISYCGTAPEDKPVMFLGKGITFNSGGINLRKCDGMDEYRGSMSGAAACVAMMRCVAALSLPINVVAIIPLCENLPSGMATKPGDVCTLLNARSMAIRDLDKAGVVVMADPMIYGQTTYKPRLVVDVATLGMGTKKAFGGGATAIFSNSHYIWKQFQRAGSLTGDRVWRLPLWQYYKKQVTDETGYDLSNDGRGLASSCLAAAVLHELVHCADWAHLDTRGTGLISQFGLIPYLTKFRMTGRPTRTLVQFLYQLACPEPK